MLLATYMFSTSNKNGEPFCRLSIWSIVFRFYFAFQNGWMELCQKKMGYIIYSKHYVVCTIDVKITKRVQLHEILYNEFQAICD